MSFSPSVPSGSTGGRCDSLQEQRERWERKRSRTARELVQSEQRYCEQLTLVNTYFVQILSAKGTLRQDVRENIFSSISSIHSINQSLLVHLENGYLGRGFETFCPQLHLYCSYVDNIYLATATLNVQVKKNKAFRRFKKLQEARPEFTSCTLEDLLPLPVQRIQQYKHFLQTLAENTCPDEPEFTQLSRSLKVISEVFQRIEDNARSHDNQMQLRRVQKLMKGRKNKILIPGRWYIREGPLRTVPPRGSEAKLRHFFLFSDMLLQAQRCGPLHPTHAGKFKGQRAFPLQDCTLDKVFGHTHSQGGLLSLTFPQAKLLLMSCDQEDMNDWFHSLTSAITKLRSKNTVIHQRDDLCRRPLRSAPGNPTSPRPLRSAPGNPTSPRPLRSAPGNPTSPRPLRSAPGNPTSPRPLRSAPGNPTSPRPLRSAPGNPKENENTPMTPGRKRTQVSEDRTEHAQNAHGGGTSSSDEPEASLSKRMRLESSEEPVSHSCVIL